MVKEKIIGERLNDDKINSISPENSVSTQPMDTLLISAFGEPNHAQDFP
jgi:hypothetical protein